MFNYGNYIYGQIAVTETIMLRPGTLIDYPTSARAVKPRSFFFFSRTTSDCQGTETLSISYSGLDVISARAT